MTTLKTLFATFWMCFPALSNASLIDRFEKSAKDWTYFKASFKQTTINAAYGTQRIRNGQLSLERPDFLRWDFTEPLGRLYIINKKNLWISDRDSSNVPTRIICDKSFNLSKNSFMTLLSSRRSEWKKHFELVSAEGSTLTFKPKKKEETLKSIAVTVEKENPALITKIVSIDALDNQTVIEFSDPILIATKSFTSLPSEEKRKIRTQFQFELPKGMQCIEAKNELTL